VAKLAVPKRDPVNEALGKAIFPLLSNDMLEEVFPLRK
jgi:hypothetical protein